MQFIIDNNALIQVDSKLNTLALSSHYLICENSAPHKQKSCTHARSSELVQWFVWQRDVIRAHAKCQAHVAYNDFLPVHRELVKDGILLCLQNCIFQLPSYRLETAFGSNNTVLL